MQDVKDELALNVAADPNLEECLHYLVLYEFDAKHPDPDTEKRIREAGLEIPKSGQLSLTMIAAILGLDRGTLRSRIALWETSGTLGTARRYLSIPRLAAIEGQIDRIESLWDQVLEKQLQTALTGSERSSLLAAAWLSQEVMKKRMAEKVEGTSEETRYLERQKGVDFTSPMVVRPKLTAG